MRQPHTDYVSLPDRSVRVFLYHVGDNKGNTAFGKVFFALNILSILDFASGLALFLFGMNVMGESLRRLSGGRPQGWLGRLCRTPLRGVALGAVATAIVQSSSAITVMVVGFVNSGIMTLSQSVGVIMGANLGTTFTSWVLSLTQLGGTAELFSPAAVASVLAAVGIVFIMDSRTGRRRDLGYAFLGFTVLIFGMELMSDTVKPLAQNEDFVRMLTVFSNPFLGILAGALLTAIIQSSSASVGILQALAASGALTRGAALPIILGQNIGTCLTTLLSGLGAGKNARRAAFIHLYFNVIGTAATLAAVGVWRLFGGLAGYLSAPADAFSIAAMHTAFNVFSTLILLPFARGLERLALLTVPDKSKKDAPVQSADGAHGFDGYSILDGRFLSAPMFAYSMARAAFFRMCGLAEENFGLAVSGLSEENEDARRKLAANERLIDAYEDSVRSYLVKIADERLSGRIYALYSAVGDAERIGDHAAVISDTAAKMTGDGLLPDAETLGELGVCIDAVRGLLRDSLTPPSAGDDGSAAEPAREAVLRLTGEVSRRIVARMSVSGDARCGICLDKIISSLERIADHAAAISAASRGSDGTVHERRRIVREDAAFPGEVEKYLHKYALPGAKG